MYYNVDRITRKQTDTNKGIKNGTQLTSIHKIILVFVARPPIWDEVLVNCDWKVNIIEIWALEQTILLDVLFKLEHKNSRIEPFIKFVPSA